MNKMVKRGLACGLIGLSLLTIGCTENSKSYNTTHNDNNGAATDDIRTLDGDKFNSMFELLSYESVDNITGVYVVRDKQTNIEYIIIRSLSSGGGITVTQRIKQ